MAKSIYIASAEGHSGKSSIALGVLHTLLRGVERVGVFRPVTRSTAEPDFVLELLLAQEGVNLDYEDCVGVSYEEVHENPDAALSRIVERFKSIERECDAVVIVGSDYTDVATPTELAYNARVAANLGAPVLLVLTGQDAEASRSRTPDELRQVAELSHTELVDGHSSLLAVVVNRAEPEQLDAIVSVVGAASVVPAWAVPEAALLSAPPVSAVRGAPRYLEALPDRMIPTSQKAGM